MSEPFRIRARPFGGGPCRLASCNDAGLYHICTLPLQEDARHDFPSHTTTLPSSNAAHDSISHMRVRPSAWNGTVSNDVSEPRNTSIMASESRNIPSAKRSTYRPPSMSVRFVALIEAALPNTPERICVCRDLFHAAHHSKTFPGYSPAKSEMPIKCTPFASSQCEWRSLILKVDHSKPFYVMELHHVRTP